MLWVRTIKNTFAARDFRCQLSTTSEWSKRTAKSEQPKAIHFLPFLY